MAKTSYDCANAAGATRRRARAKRRTLLPRELLRRERPRVRDRRIVSGRRLDFPVQRRRLLRVAELFVRLGHQELDERVVLARFLEIGERRLGVAGAGGGG